VGGVTVVIIETSAAQITDSGGNYAFNNVPVGDNYTISFTLGVNVETQTGVAVTAGGSTQYDLTVGWDIGFAETLTVTAASRRIERIVEAPAAVTSISELEIQRNASHGQVPKLLEFTPGAEVTQSGIYDYNFNTRGFNSSLNRRVATLIDGRNPAVPFLGAQEWAAVSFPLDDISSLELVRGPSAALYGANASSGVLNMTTKDPRLNPGGHLRLTGGELETINFDGRWAGELGGNWYMKAVGGVRYHDDFSVSRNGAAEYSEPCPVPQGTATNCLPQEAIPLQLDKDKIYFGGVRFDKYLANGMVFTMEGGLADIAGPVFQTGIGRVQLIDVQRPWARFNFNTGSFNFLAYWNARRAPTQAALASGANLALDSNNYNFEAQYNTSFADDKIRLVLGAFAKWEDIDSFDPATGRQSLMFEPVEENFQAIFGQVDFNVTDQLKVVLAGRFDESTLHDAEFNPKASVVYSFNPNHTARFTYNEAFQVANYSEFFLQADVALPADLSALEPICGQFGVSCGFDQPTRVLGLGNSDLNVEKIRTFEVGYSGIFAAKAFFTIDYYNSRADDFITDLLPNVGTPLGRVNPNFGPWEGPEGLPAPAEALIRSLAPPILSNNFDGSNILAAVSYTNFGEVDTQGIDVGLNYYPIEDWTLSFAYSWFDWEAKDAPTGFEFLLLPNTPEHKVSFGLNYAQPLFDFGFNVRWVDEFLWAVGPFRGVVESYTTVDLSANWNINERVTVGANIANLFNNEHWEAFGGDLLARRALVNVRFAF
jgi:iron complex outermembrane receptor protein